MAKPVGELGHEDLVLLDPTKVRMVDGRNARFDYGNLDELAASIAENGVKNPVRVQLADDNVYELEDGHRRLKACLLAIEKYNKKVKLPARVIPKETSGADIVVDMLVANDGKPFLPLEEAELLKRLRDSGLKTDQIAKRVGKSVSHVSDRLSLLGADESVREAIESGDMTASDAVTVVRKSKGDKEKQRETVDRVKKEGPQVVTKELKKGRLQRQQWEAAETVYSNLWSALSAHKGIAEAKELLESKDPTKDFADDDKYYSIYCLGRMQGAAELAGLTLAEMVKKCEARVSGKGEK